VRAVRGYMPYIGYMTIVLTEYPWLKVTLIGMIGLSSCCYRVHLESLIETVGLSTSAFTTFQES